MATFILRQKSRDGKILPNIYAESETALAVLSNYLHKNGVLSKPVFLGMVVNGWSKHGADYIEGERKDCLVLLREMAKVESGILAYEVKSVPLHEIADTIAIGIADDTGISPDSYAFRFASQTSDNCGQLEDFTLFIGGAACFHLSQNLPSNKTLLDRVQYFVDICHRECGMPEALVVSLDEKGAELAYLA